MTERNAIWIVLLRPCDDGSMIAIGVATLREVAETARQLGLKMRFNAIRLVTMRLPAGTRREQVYDAFKLLSNDERLRLYNLPQRSIMGRAA